MIYILIVLVHAMLRQASGTEQIKVHDITKYMVVHQNMIRETQSLYSQSMDNEVLKAVAAITEAEGTPNTHLPNKRMARVVGSGEGQFLSMAGQINIEKGEDIDREFKQYCNHSNTMVYRVATSSTILCNSTDIIEITKNNHRRKRDVGDGMTISSIQSEVHKYIESCKGNCLISGMLRNKLEKCKESWTKNMSFISRENCHRMYTLAYRIIRDSAVVQPSIHHFFDNMPHRKLLSIHSSLEDIPKIQKILETSLVDCLGQEKVDPNSDECMRIVSSDMNAIYKLFNNKVPENANHHILRTSDPYRQCEPEDHVWKGVLVTPSITGDHDTVAYTTKKINEDGANVTLHCLTTICDLCIKEVPVLLSGKCTLKHRIASDSHVVKLCNQEKSDIGYFVRLVHSGPRLDNGYSYRSRFLLMNIYSYAHEKLIGANLKLVDNSEGPQIIKGAIKRESCINVNVGDLKNDWLQYYVKCGQNIYHHNEHLSEGYRCNLKYNDWKMAGMLKWTCYNWYYIRFFIIVMASMVFIYLLWVLRVYRYIALLLCMITSPLSYIMYKYWPNFARCARCGLPWLPWHTCNEICLCGEKFDEEHRLQCEFYCMESVGRSSSKIEQGLFKPVDIVIPNIGSMNYISHVKSQKRRLMQQEKTIDSIEYGGTVENQKKGRKDNMLFLFQAFSSFRNPFTVFTVRFSLFLIIYIILCLLVPVSIADCLKCTDRCKWNGRSFTEDCKGVSENCICILTTKCENGQTQLLQRSSIGQDIEEIAVYKIDGCLKGDYNDLPYAVDYIIAAHMESIGCYKNLSTSEEELRKFILRMATAMPTHAKLYLIGKSNDDCKSIREYFKENFDLPDSILEGTRIILNSVSEYDTSRDLTVKGVMYSDSKDIDSHTQDDFKDSIRPIQDVVEESRREEKFRKGGELIQEFQSILNLLKYNGSIFGRDHTITIPQAPSFIQHVYTAQSTDTTTVLDMTMQAIAGTAAAFRPVSNGKEVPITFIISVPEVAGVYSLKYQYTTCKTSVIDSVRYDSCVSSCDTCFKSLHENALDSTKLTKFFDPDRREKVSFIDPNTWGCEGKGCWTINTGCLCAYCANVPDPKDCFDIYSVSYHSSKALICLSINEDHQCEQVTVGKVVERQGKIQMLLEGNDEWSSLIKTEMIAVHRSNGEVLTGLINGLGESAGNFGSPQYNRNLSLLFKVRDVDAHYICKTGSDQEVVFDSCFRDTWPMKKELQKSASFFLDSHRGYIYHMGKNVGTIKIILNVPVEKVEWKTTDLHITINQANCVGCYSCLNGIHCTIEAESTHSGLVYIYSSPCIIRVSTLNILRGVKRYNITLDCNEKPMKPYIVMKDGNEKEIAKKSLRMTLNEGNTPRTTERNSTNNEYNIAGQNDNTISGIGDFFRKWNPITALSSFFSSSFMHWVLYLILSIAIIACILLAVYYIVTITLRKVTNKVILGKQE